jgi:hypothetical protein
MILPIISVAIHYKDIPCRATSGVTISMVQSVKKLPHFVIRDIKNQAQGESCSNIRQLSCIWLDGQRWMNGYPLRHQIQDFVRCECIAKKNILILIRLTLMYIPHNRVPKCYKYKKRRTNHKQSFLYRIYKLYFSILSSHMTGDLRIRHYYYL